MQLESLEEGERAWALDSLARLLSEDAAVFARVVDAADVLPRVVRALRDPHRTVRRAAAGIVRNALLVGEERVADKLLALDVTLAIEAALQEAPVLVRDATPQFESKAMEESDKDASVAEDLLVQSLAYTALLWCVLPRLPACAPDRGAS